MRRRRGSLRDEKLNENTHTGWTWQQVEEGGNVSKLTEITMSGQRENTSGEEKMNAVGTKGSDPQTGRDEPKQQWLETFLTQNKKLSHLRG